MLFTLPAFAGVDDDWRNLYSQAQYAAVSKDYAKAEAIYNKALHEAERFGSDDVRVASTLQGLGVTLRREKRLTDAEGDLERAVSIYSTNPGDDSLEFALAQTDLAGVLTDEGKYQPALQSLTLALPIFDHKLAPEDNQIAAALCMQGDTYRMLKMYSRAEVPLRRCADIRADDGGVGTAEFGEAANSLAIVYQFTGKYAEADLYFNYAETIRVTSLGFLSPEFAATLEAHAILLHQLGQDKEAKDKEKLAAQIRSHTSRK